MNIKPVDPRGVDASKAIKRGPTGAWVFRLIPEIGIGVSSARCCSAPGQAGWAPELLVAGG